MKPIVITFKFAASENREDLDVGDIRVPTKDDWDYLWVRYEKTEENGQVLPVPVQAYIEKIYERFAFAQLFGCGSASRLMSSDWVIAQVAHHEIEVRLKYRFYDGYLQAKHRKIAVMYCAAEKRCQDSFLGS